MRITRSQLKEIINNSLIVEEDEKMTEEEWQERQITNQIIDTFNPCDVVIPEEYWRGFDNSIEWWSSLSEDEKIELASPGGALEQWQPPNWDIFYSIGLFPWGEIMGACGKGIAYVEVENIDDEGYVEGESELVQAPKEAVEEIEKKIKEAEDNPDDDNLPTVEELEEISLSAESNPESIKVEPIIAKDGALTTNSSSKLLKKKEEKPKKKEDELAKAYQEMISRFWKVEAYGLVTFEKYSDKPEKYITIVSPKLMDLFDGDDIVIDNKKFGKINIKSVEKNNPTFIIEPENKVIKPFKIDASGAERDDFTIKGELKSNTKKSNNKNKKSPEPNPKGVVYIQGSQIGQLLTPGTEGDFSK